MYLICSYLEPLGSEIHKIVIRALMSKSGGPLTKPKLFQVSARDGPQQQTLAAVEALRIIPRGSKYPNIGCLEFLYLES